MMGTSSTISSQSSTVRSLVDSLDDDDSSSSNDDDDGNFSTNSHSISGSASSVFIPDDSISCSSSTASQATNGDGRRTSSGAATKPLHRQVILEEDRRDVTRRHPCDNRRRQRRRPMAYQTTNDHHTQFHVRGDVGGSDIGRRKVNNDTMGYSNSREGGFEVGYGQNRGSTNPTNQRGINGNYRRDVGGDTDCMSLHKKNTFDSVSTTAATSLTEYEGTPSVKSWVSSLSGFKQFTPHDNNLPHYRQQQQKQQQQQLELEQNSHLQHRNEVHESPLILQSNPSTDNDRQMLVLQPKTTRQNIHNHTQQHINELQTRSARSKPTLKNLLSTVQQLPRPRLIPFTPVASISRQPTTNDSQTQLVQHVINASTFARNSPRAGYLSKLGTSIPEYKRRFFVLKPTTFLYYFLSPDDVEPRGCIDLEGLAVEDDEGSGGMARSSGDEVGAGSGLSIKELGCLNDGRFRFEIRLPIQHCATDATTDNEGNSNDAIQQQQERRIISLEARTETVGREWINSLTTERLSYSKAKVCRLQQERAEFQRQIRDYRHMEEDRDGAIQDAKEWKERYGKLDDALSLLAGWVRKEAMVDCREDVGGDLSRNSGGGVLKERGEEGNSREDVETNSNTREGGNSCDGGQDRRMHPSFSEEDMILDRIDLPGTNFASLYNACRGMREVIRQTSIEANTAIIDLRNTNSSMKKLETKINKAEAVINKLWGENCELRDNLKQVKKERKVLVKEVRSLLSNEKEMKDGMTGLKGEVHRLRKIVVANNVNIRCKDAVSGGHHTTQRYQKDVCSSDEQKSPKVAPQKRRLATPEKKLLMDLEKHVESSLRLHEQYLESNGQHDLTEVAESKQYNTKTTIQIKGEKKLLLDLEKHVESSLRLNEQYLEDNGQHGAAESERCDTKTTTQAKETIILEDRKKTEEVSNLVPSASTSEQQQKNLPHKVFEAREGNSSSSESNEYDTKEDPINRTFSPLRPKQLLCLDENGCDADSVITSDSIVPLQDRSSSVNVPEEIIGNSLDKVTLLGTVEEKENRGKDNHGKPPRAQSNEELAVDDSSVQLLSSSQSVTSTKSLITDNCRATSQLVCPLPDIMQLDDYQGERSDLDRRNDGELYHLTFYSSKIGLQFQKVPGNGSSFGTLKDAMADDVATKASRMALELEKISLIRNQGRPQPAVTKDSLCPTALPADIVLVCGFFGFDENEYTRKPSLGARLVAFDGISIERGSWTFDEVKKGIKARGRPLTLSFRDDFLTTKQRSILTKAAAEVKATIPRSRPIRTLQYLKPPYINDSVSRHSSHMHDSVSRHSSHMEAENNESIQNESITAAVTPNAYFEQSQQNTTFESDAGTSVSYSSRSENWQSFSDSGASSVFSTKFGPFMSGLMLGLSNNEEKRRKKSEKFTPEYFRRTSEPLDCISHHRDFKASLL